MYINIYICKNIYISLYIFVILEDIVESFSKYDHRQALQCLIKNLPYLYSLKTATLNIQIDTESLRALQKPHTLNLENT